MGSSRKLIAAIAGLGAVGAVCVITFAAVMLSAPRDTSELLSLPDFTVSHQVLSVLGMHPASTHTRVNRWQRSTSSAQLPARAPKDQRDRNVKATLKEISQLKENLASMSRRDRDVVLRLEKRRLALTHCDSVGCRAAPPLVWRERKMLSQLASPTRSSSSSSSSSSDEDGEEPEQDGEEGGGEEGNEDASGEEPEQDGEEPEQDGEEPEQDGEEGEETREEGEGPEEHKEKIRNVYRTSGGGQSPKGVGTARIGDPVLNKHDKSIYRRRCENDFDCVTDGWETMSDDYEDDHAHKERQRLWRRTRQLDRSIDISANQDMKEQMTELMRDTERSVHECKKYFRVVSSDAVAACERRAVRHTCYIFESLSETCDTAKEQRFNRLDGTYYFTENELPKSCTSAQRTRLLELCRPAEKLPGLAVSHWPWQGQSLNRNKLGFSGDSILLGPYGFSGRADYFPKTRDIPNNKLRDRSTRAMMGGGGHGFADDVWGGMGGS